MKTSSAERFRSGVEKVLSWILAAYGGCLILVLSANLLFTEANPLVGLVRTFFSLMMLPALLFLPLALLLRRWRLSALLFPAFVGFFAYYGAFLLPRGDQPAGGGHGIRLMSFNIQFTQDEFDSLGAILRDTAPDIVALQEVSPEAARFFKQEFEHDYPHQALHPRQQDHAGQGLLSRIPIRRDRYVRFEDLEAKLGHQYVELEVDGQTLTVINTHPVPPYAPERGFNARPHTLELNRIVEHARQVKGPLILVGDFNMSDQFEEYELLVGSYRDAFREVGEIELGFTYPNGRRLPLPQILRLDYFFYNDFIHALWARTVPESGSSDHRPLLVQFTIEEEP